MSLRFLSSGRTLNTTEIHNRYVVADVQDVQVRERLRDMTMILKDIRELLANR
jgi:hypothetical protein